MTKKESESILSSFRSTSSHELCPGGAGIKNLPDPDEFPGVKFILESIKSPRLIDQNGPTSKGYMRYYERDQCHLWWFQRWFSWAPYWFTFFWYCSTKGDRVSCTRDELCLAWVKALNGARYHQLLHHHALPKCDPKMKSTLDDLKVVADMWLSLFREIDWAMGILHQMQIDRTMPQAWKHAKTGWNVTKLSDWNDHLTCVSTSRNLTACFINCVRYIIYLDAKGYNKDFEVIAKSIGFRGHKVCEIPGLPDKITYDDDFVLTNN
ncbi:hypothetical protein I302_101215 [Kwoniella bestiolae CBS 10118]|uniref:Uncharacterized protein n=1 Tax=Kwoniella bestiolae CBS 10118 TaxID=1296100 RepID=A0A1B9G794_9TREE|nr:hypothetical protein I302_04588 [Kwoniella bestiolae CBS 10118]OCF26898.1 hypothetical protein I302_04588 [Kwoniella bestiolae CBS 10118]